MVSKVTKLKPKKETSTCKENLVIDSDITAKTEPQRQMILGYLEGMNILAKGSAGTGKTYVAMYLALKDLFENEKQKIFIIRSAVQSRDMGAMPGDLEEKTSLYHAPYIGATNSICRCGTAWSTLYKKNYIEFHSTSFLRGMTIDNATVIIDEAQNMDDKELETILTRVGENTQVIICGDTRQDDLFRRREKSGLKWLERVAERMTDWFEVVNFRPEDVVRSGFVGDLIRTIEDMENDK